MPTKPNWRMLAAMLSVSLLATACGPKPLVVRPAEPLPPPTIAVPSFLLTCPPIPSWYRQAKCEDGQTLPPTR